MDINAFIASYIATNNTALSTIIRNKIVSDTPALSAYSSAILASIVSSLGGVLTTAMLADSKWIKDEIVDDRYRQFPLDNEGNKGYFQAISDRNKKLKELGLYVL